MKLIRLLLVTVLSFFVLSFPSFANQAISLNKAKSFNPVDFTVTMTTGGFSLKNDTARKQFVQVVLNKGSIALSKRTSTNGTVFIAALGGNSVEKSVVCELAANETLQVDKDFADDIDATGTYQIEMGN